MTVGEYNPDTVAVLHLRNNPLTDADAKGGAAHHQNCVVAHTLPSAAKEITRLTVEVEKLNRKLAAANMAQNAAAGRGGSNASSMDIERLKKDNSSLVKRLERLKTIANQKISEVRGSALWSFIAKSSCSPSFAPSLRGCSDSKLTLSLTRTFTRSSCCSTRTPCSSSKVFGEGVVCFVCLLIVCEALPDSRVELLETPFALSLDASIVDCLQSHDSIPAFLAKIVVAKVLGE